MSDQKPGPLKTRVAQLPYRLREHFLSTPELALFHLLQKIAGQHYLICPKVSLNDIFYIVRPNENVHFFNKFFRKHVDFLLCDPVTLRPSIGIELMKPVSKTEAREADQFMDDLFLSVGLPLVHIQSSEHYVEQDVTRLFEIAIRKVKETKPLGAIAQPDSVPMCPVCGRMMVLRIDRNGENAGRQYYGCVNNPHCPGTVEIIR
jgi:hypothetical protein